MAEAENRGGRGHHIHLPSPANFSAAHLNSHRAMLTSPAHNPDSPHVTLHSLSAFSAEVAPSRYRPFFQQNYGGKTAC